jgi:hypothetical protein
MEATRSNAGFTGCGVDSHQQLVCLRSSASSASNLCLLRTRRECGAFIWSLRDTNGLPVAEPNIQAAAASVVWIILMSGAG